MTATLFEPFSLVRRSNQVNARNFNDLGAAKESFENWLPINNKFERALRRLLHQKTEKVILQEVCEQPTPPPSKLTITATHIEIWIATTQVCLQVQTASAPTKNKT